MGNSAEDQPLEGTIEEAEHRRAVPEHARQAYFMAEAANLVRQLADKPQLRSVFGWSLTVIASAPSSLIAANWQSVEAGGLISYWAQSLDPVRTLFGLERRRLARARAFRELPRGGGFQPELI